MISKFTNDSINFLGHQVAYFLIIFYGITIIPEVKESFQWIVASMIFFIGCYIAYRGLVFSGIIEVNEDDK